MEKYRIVPQCRICGSTEKRVLIPQSRAGRIVRCLNCGTLYVHQRDVSGLIPSHREDNPIVFSEEIHEDYVKEKDIQMFNFQQRLKILNRFLPQKGRLLDVGCCTGNFLEIAKDNGWDVYGVEPYQANAEYCQAQGFNVQPATLLETNFENNFFDAITMFHLVEHLDDPKEDIKKAWELLKPGGILVVETPNADSLPFKILGKYWRQIMDCHYFYFTAKTLASLIKDCKYDVILIQSIGKHYTWEMLWNRLKYQKWGRNLKWLKSLMKKLGLEKRRIPLYVNTGDVMLVLTRKVV